MTDKQIDELHPDDAQLWFTVEAAAWRLAREAEIPLREVGPVLRKQTQELMGLAWQKEKRIALRLREHNGRRWSPVRDEPHQIVDTLCHELAHVAAPREDHGPNFLREFGKLLIAASKLDVLALIERACSRT